MQFQGTILPVLLHFNVAIENHQSYQFCFERAHSIGCDNITAGSSRKKQRLMLDLCEFSPDENVLVKDNLKWIILH